MLALLAVGGHLVAQLMVRNVNDAVVRELKKRAARRNHSAEQEHREILEQALLRPQTPLAGGSARRDARRR